MFAAGPGGSGGSGGRPGNGTWFGVALASVLALAGITAHTRHRGPRPEPAPAPVEVD